MKLLFYRILTLLTRFFGSWFFTLVSGGIAAGYFLFFPGRVAVGMDFYRALFPRRGLLFHLWCTFRQFLDFTNVFRDRLLLADQGGGLATTFDGWERLRDAMQGSGGVLLMSHLGNWEVAARLLKKTLPDLKMMLYMGVKQQEQIEAMQKRVVRKSDIRIVAVDESGGSPLDIVESVRFLREGGLVSLTGDRVWHADQRTVPVRFLGQPVHLPAAPYLLAMAAGAPIFVFFALRTRGRHYLFCASEPIFIDAADRAQRDTAVARAAQQYADLLEKTVRRYPFQWHHFEPFIGK
ncbi:lysophospholipid acyltransferase family protein [uncultured Desulfosarcina sp.]|uniref:lysophospholipid acyltransferase family protein n=1 Tax=uncultured Desulfosarcina sp. TaxID=218289 RepID=UPI0029C7DC6F|nr:lysophospholipid acyltransferase family protein [uncultured Desulfosarcina sp.]